MELKNRHQWAAEFWVLVRGRVRRVLDPVVGAWIRALIELGIAWAAEAANLDIFSALQKFWNPKGADLDRRGADLPIPPRFEGSKSVGDVYFEVNADMAPIDVEAGAIVRVGTSTETTKTFQTLADTKLTASGLIACEALAVGEAGNVIAGEIDTLVSTIAGIVAVTNPADFSDGANREDDANYRKRQDAFWDQLPKASPAALEYAAIQVSGVLFSGCREHFPAPGESTLYACDRNGWASKALLARVETKIETGGPSHAKGYRASGGKTWVSRPARYLAIATAKVTMKAGKKVVDYATAIEEALQNRIGELGLGAAVTLSQLGAAIEAGVSQVDDVSTVTVRIIEMPEAFPVRVLDVGGPEWTSSVWEWNYSGSMIRWNDGPWFGVKDPTAASLIHTFYDAAGESWIKASVTPFTSTENEWPAYSHDEEVAAGYLGEVTEFTPGEIMVAGGVTVEAAPITSTLGVS